MRNQPTGDNPEDQREKTASIWQRLLHETPMGEYESQALKRSIVAASVIVAGLIGLIWYLGLQHDPENARRAALIELRFQESSRLLDLQHEFSLFNGTGKDISMWVREDATPPPLPGESISGLHDIQCSGPECAIRRTTTAKFQVQRKTRDPEALMAINAWIATTGEIVYSNHMTQQELDGFSWRLFIADQR